MHSLEVSGRGLEDEDNIEWDSHIHVLAINDIFVSSATPHATAINGSSSELPEKNTFSTECQNQICVSKPTINVIKWI